MKEEDREREMRRKVPHNLIKNYWYQNILLKKRLQLNVEQQNTQEKVWQGNYVPHSKY